MCDCVIEWGQSSDRRAAQTERELRPERHGPWRLTVHHGSCAIGRGAAGAARRGRGGRDGIDSFKMFLVFVFRNRAPRVHDTTSSTPSPNVQKHVWHAVLMYTLCDRSSPCGVPPVG
jgi:hypothetical protein